jgi:hypothetical protein
MTFHHAPYTVLARNERNWYILQLGDGRIQLDFGPFAVAFGCKAFQVLHSLVEAALEGPTVAGCIAHAGVERSIWFDPQRGTLLLAFDGMVLRFLSHELLAFTCLCRAAATKLGTGPLPPPSSAGSLN